VHLSYDKAFRLIGEKISTDTIKNILDSLDIKINNQTESGLGLTIPSYRVDVTREADIVEEILRVYGYNNIKTSDKLNTSLSFSGKNNEKYENIISGILVAHGFYETMANSLTTPDYVSLSENLSEEHNVKMLNALSSDLEVMRQSLLFSGLEAVAYNINRKNNNIKFFEFGKTYHKFQSGYTEQKHLSLVVSGKRWSEAWNVQNKVSDFFYLKGIVVSVLSRFGFENLKVTAAKNDIFSEGITISNKKIRLVEMGVVKNSILKNFGIKQEVLYADFNWDNVLEHAGNKKITVSQLSKYPEVKRDLALLLNEDVKFSDLYQAAFQSEKKFLKNIDLFDVYTGDKLPEGKKSYALSFILQDESKTLNDKQIDKIMSKLQQTFTKQFGAELR
jgi:phenylalanyl-tRNA synthetase beta chain